VKRKTDIPPVASLRSVEAVTRLRSVTAAARELKISHPAVSQALTRLEEEFSTPLFLDHDGGPSPTPIAQALSNIYRTFARDFTHIRSKSRAQARRAPSIYICQSLISAILPFINRAVGEDLKVSSITSDPAELEDRPFDLVVDRTDQHQPRHNGLICAAPETLVIAAFNETKSAGEMVGRVHLYVPSMWFTLWKYEISPLFKDLNINAREVGDVGSAISLARISSATCLCDQAILNATCSGDAYNILTGIAYPTGYYYIASSHEEQIDQNRLSVFWNWMGLDMDRLTA
jgi:hypothetical protein